MGINFTSHPLMRNARRTFTLLIAFVCVLPPVIAQQPHVLPSIPDVPATVLAAVRLSFLERRQSLLDRKRALAEALGRQQSECGNVESNSAEDARCRNVAASIHATFTALSEDIDRFRSDLKSALAVSSVLAEESNLGGFIVDPDSAAAITRSGMLYQDAKTFCEYVEHNGGEMVVQNVHYGSLARKLISRGEVTPKPIGVTFKSSDRPGMEGLVPRDQSKSKLPPNKVAAAEAEIEKCCITRDVDGVPFVADHEGKVFVSDYDFIALSYGAGRPVTDGPFGHGTDAARDAIYEMNLKLILPIQNLDAAHNPDCAPPRIPLGATAFERSISGECLATTLNDRAALDTYLHSKNIQVCWSATASGP